jgi:hypothetical protein
MTILILLAVQDAAHEEFLQRALARLGSDEYADREEAERFLGSFGPKLAGWLSSQRDRAVDPEIRDRIDGLVRALRPPPQPARARRHAGIPWYSPQEAAELSGQTGRPVAVFVDW